MLMPKKIKSRVTLIVLAALIVAAFAYWFFPRGENLPDNIVFGNGRVEMRRIDVATLHPGKLSSVEVEEGAFVNRDQVLAQMEATEPDAQMSIAQAAKERALQARARARAEREARQEQLNTAKIDYQNARVLRQEKLISDSELQKRKAAFKAQEAVVRAASAAGSEADAAVMQADAQIARIENIQNDMLIKSPLDGRVQYRLVEPGSVIPAGGRVVTILDVSDVSLSIFLPATDVSRLKVNAEARILFDGLDAVFPARISHIADEAQFTPKYVETRNEREKLMFRVKLTIDPEVAMRHADLIKSGLRAEGYVNMGGSWPSWLNVRDPKDIQP